MNTIKKADRLTEAEVHTVIANMIEAGEKPSALSLLKTLGRGSLTTISKYLASFNSANDEGKAEVNLPALVDVPRELGLSGELLIKKIWTDARTLANQEIDSQRAALVQAEAEATAKIAEAMEFSEMQAKRIEELESLVDDLNKMAEFKEAEVIRLEKTAHQLRLDLATESKNKEIAINSVEQIKESLKRVDKDNDELRKKIVSQAASYDKKINDREESLVNLHGDIKTLEKMNSSLELQIGKNQIVFDQQANELNALKNELKTCKAECKDAVKLAAKLTGKLEVYENQKKV